MSRAQEDKNLIEYQLVQVDQQVQYDQGYDNEGEGRKEQITEEELGDQGILISQPQQRQDGLFGKVKSYYYALKTLLKKHSIKIYAGISIALSILVLALYFSLKQRCPYDSDHVCLKEFIFPNLFKWMAIVAFNSTATLIQFHMMIQKSTFRVISGYGFVQSLYLFIFNDNTINLHYYMGGINAIHLILFVILLVFYSIIRLWVACFKKSRIICFFGNVAFISLVAFAFYNRSVIHGCDYWSKGINGELVNRDGMCQVPIPTLCWYKITHNWQDVSLLLPQCNKSSSPSDAKDKIDQFFSPYVQDSRYIAFSNLNNVPELNRTDEKIQFTAFQNAKGYSSLEQAQQDSYDVVFDRKELKYHIDVQFNKTLSEERKKLAEELAEKSLSKNVLLIFIDAVSRQSMHLKMPKTVEWFEKRTKQFSYKQDNKQNEEEKKQSQSFEFYKYNSLKPYTYDNLQNLMYGRKVRDIKLSEDRKLVSIVEDMKQRGYITGHSSDQCQTLSLSFDDETLQLMKSSRYDHETQSYACDPNFQDPESTFGLFQGPYSIIRRCLYEKTMADYPLEYAKTFFNKYKENKKFMHLEFSYGHEGTGEVINYLDDPLSNFLEEMSDSGLLKDTTVILFNDHGLHMQGIFYLLNLKNVFIEINLPGLFINIPPEINEKYGDQIALNQQNLVSIINLHHFIKHITVGETYQDNYDARKSLMNPLYNQKYCADIGVSRDDCSCQ